jgi:hypothetical protein
VRFNTLNRATGNRLKRKKRRPVSLHEGLRESLRMIPANEQPKATMHRLRRRG